MWWKLTILLITTVGLIIAVIPIRTHASPSDPSNPPASAYLLSIISNMYLTTGTVALICVVLLVAGYIAARIVRSG